ncbi:MAG: hypothetical protein QW660_06885 [Candidatus Bathyarchaeia archaeon]
MIITKLMVKPRCIKKIAEFSDHYRREILNEEYLKRYHDVDVKRLRDDWWEALNFLPKGRRDDLSYEVERRIRTVLGKYFNDPQLKDKNLTGSDSKAGADSKKT